MNAAHVTAIDGVSARVATTVTIESAMSWNPLSKSKISATMIVRMIRVVQRAGEVRDILLVERSHEHGVRAVRQLMRDTVGEALDFIQRCRATTPDPKTGIVWRQARDFPAHGSAA
jgi:hypothetical protein